MLMALSLYPVLYRIYSSSRFKFLKLPGEIQAGIAKQLDGRSLACLARTCRILRVLAESILFQNIKLYLDKDRGFLSRRKELSPALLKALALHTCDLRLVCTWAWIQGQDRDVPLEHARLLNVLRACAPGRLQALRVHFAVDTSLALRQSEYLEVATSKRFPCEIIDFDSCSWSVVEPFVVQSESSLRNLRWALPPRDMSETSRAGKLQTFRLQAAHVPNLTSLSLALRNVESNIAISLLEELAPQLRSLTLHNGRGNDRDLSLWSAERLPAWKFPLLWTFSCWDVANDLYLSVISACPELRKIEYLNMHTLRNSVLDTLPASLEFLGMPSPDGVWTSLEQEPLEGLPERLRRLKNLRQLPVLLYNEHNGDRSVCSDIKRRLLEHFDALGVIYTQEECDDFLAF